jgi:hypothetical protein
MQNSHGGVEKTCGELVESIGTQTCGEPAESISHTQAT